MVGSVIHRVAVIGAGMAGLVCARQLADAGRRVVVFDKSGDIGGRLATRRRDGLWWNHGAPAVHVRSREFLALLESLERRGSATAIPGEAVARFVGRPDMRELLRPLVEGLDCRFGCPVARLAPGSDGWRVALHQDEAAEPAFDAVVVAIPAPQAAALLAASGLPLPDGMEAVRMSPCWTLLTAHGDRQPGLRQLGQSEAIERSTVTDLGPDGPTTCVLHAPAAWSASRLEQDADAVALALYAVLSAVCPADLPAPDYLAAHRWRYARASAPLGRDCVWLPDLGIGLAGDWCPGGDAEGACLSGRALAGRILQA